MQENCSDSDDCNLQDGWLIQLAEKSAISQRAAYNWWAAFTKSANLSITPKQATDENRQAFFAWLDEQKQAEEAEKALEEVMALTELVDASLLEFSDEYAPLATIQEPKWRVRTLLGKLESDRANKTDYFITKFSDKVDEIFSGLPFTRNDLPLLFTASDVQRFALEHRLNKAQTKAVDALQKAAPDVFKAIAKSTPVTPRCQRFKNRNGGCGRC